MKKYYQDYRVFDLYDLQQKKNPQSIAVATKQNGVLLNGFGAVTVERPLILYNPTRIVYDLPNTFFTSETRYFFLPHLTDGTSRIFSYHLVLKPGFEHQLNLYIKEGY